MQCGRQFVLTYRRCAGYSGIFPGAYAGLHRDMHHNCIRLGNRNDNLHGKRRRNGGISAFAISIMQTGLALVIAVAMLYLLSKTEQAQQLAIENGWGDGLAELQDLIEAPAESVAEKIDEVTGMSISRMANVTAAHVAHPNVQAFLRVIRRGEGTADEAGYRRIFGGRLFTSFADHPRIKVTASGYTSTAAGAYQFLASTWDETARIMKLADFSPANQDRGAVGRLVFRRALDDVIAGRFAQAIAKCGKEWASLPGSPYGQPTITMQTAQTVYTQSGGQYA